MAECGSGPACGGSIGGPQCAPCVLGCVIIAAPIVLILGIVFSAECEYDGPNYLIAGALMCGIIVSCFATCPSRKPRLTTEGPPKSQTPRINEAMKCIGVLFIWICVVIPTIITAIVLLNVHPCFTTNWKKRRCEVKEIKMTKCTSLLGGDGFYYEYVLEANLKKCKKNNAKHCVYDDSNGFTDCEQSQDLFVGDVVPCWAYYDDNECMECSCDGCSDGYRGEQPDYIPVYEIEPTMSPTVISSNTTAPTVDNVLMSTTAENEVISTAFPSNVVEWKAEMCSVRYVNTTSCGIGGTGKYYKYTLNVPHSASIECIYDDSNGNTDCEYTATHSVADLRQCWVGYLNGTCSQCSCQDCDDSSRGDKPSP